MPVLYGLSHEAHEATMTATEILKIRETMSDNPNPEYYTDCK